MDYGLLKVDWGLLFDPVSSVMSFIVVTIAFCVHLYTLDYMKDDANFIKFYIYLNIFTFFMLLFVTADNFLQMFLG
jgi:NADH-quinone oxidoreductase subunit L